MLSVLLFVERLNRRSSRIQVSESNTALHFTARKVNLISAQLLLLGYLINNSLIYKLKSIFVYVNS